VSMPLLPGSFGAGRGAQTLVHGSRDPVRRRRPRRGAVTRIIVECRPKSRLPHLVSAWSGSRPRRLAPPIRLFRAQDCG
jgi:hypothetical protein